jgi:predicted metal-dependent peptidase
VSTFNLYRGLYTDGGYTAKNAADLLANEARESFSIAYLLRNVRSLEESRNLPTAGVDKTGRILINPDYWAAQTATFKVGLVLHELLHPALNYFGRLGTRNHQQFNIAQDMVINTIITDGLRKPMSHAALLPPAEYTGPLTSEAIYDWLMSFPPDKRPQGGEGIGEGCGQLSDADAEGVSEKECDAPAVGKPLSKQEIKDAMRAMGGSMARVFERMEPRPQVLPQWKRYMRKVYSNLMAQQSGSSFPSYAKAKKRGGCLLPTYRGRTPRVAIVIDSSGSMNDSARNEIVQQATTFAKQYPQIDTLVVTHTDKVEFIGWARAGTMSRVAQTACGFTGGTYVQPAYDEVRKQAQKVDVLIHFTDCYIENPWPTAPAKKLVVCDYGSGNGVSTPRGAEKVKMVLR